MNIDKQKKRQCLGRNLNWRRCGRLVVGKWFCADHKWQPWILISFLIFTIVPGLITIRTYIWNEQISPDYNNEQNLILNNSPEAPLSDVNESLHKNRDAKTDEITFMVYNSTSKKMEKVEPIEGELYEIRTRNGSKFEYMVEDSKVYTEHTSADGKRKSYSVSDLQGNLLDSKFPHKLEDYTVVIPSDLELKRSERLLSNGWNFVEVDLKWDGKVEMILDPRGKLQQVKIEGGCRTNHKLKTLVAGRIDKTNKWILPNKTGAGGRN